MILSLQQVEAKIQELQLTAQSTTRDTLLEILEALKVLILALPNGRITFWAIVVNAGKARDVIILIWKAIFGRKEEEPQPAE